MFGETHRDVADAIGELAALDAAEGLQVLWSDDRTARTHARREATRARAVLARYLAPDHAELRVIDDWLAQRPA